jgi:lysophospholipase L1-like esterase
MPAATTNEDVGQDESGPSGAGPAGVARYLTVPATSGDGRYRLRASLDPGPNVVLIVATVTGLVSDPSGAPAPGVIVTATNQATNIAAWIGAAPRYRGRSDAWRFKQAIRGISSTLFGRIWP